MSGGDAQLERPRGRSETDATLRRMDARETGMKTYYLIMAIAASLAAIAMATTPKHDVPRERAQEKAEIDPETEAWFI